MAGKRLAERIQNKFAKTDRLGWDWLTLVRLWLGLIL